MLIFQDFSKERVDCEYVSGIFLDSRDAEHFPFRDFFRAKKFEKLFSFGHFQVGTLLDRILRGLYLTSSNLCLPHSSKSCKKPSCHPANLVWHEIRKAVLFRRTWRKFS